MIKLKSKRLLLEPIGMKHLSKDYVVWMNDLEVIKYMSSGGDYTIEKLKGYLLEQERKKILFWAIILKGTNKHIGNIKIDPIDEENKSAEYGILIGDKKEWGKGYAFEASKKIISYCFNKLNINTITLGVNKSNKTAIRLYNKLGFIKYNLKDLPDKYKNSNYKGLRMYIDKNLNKIILGTAQFGMDYGINNKKGKINQEEVFKILKYSYNNGIRNLDTAEIYGDAINVIGEFHKKNPDKKFNIFSKAISEPKEINYSKNISSNINKLNINKYEGYMIHNYKFFKENKKIYTYINSAKQAGLINKIGVSIYTNDEIKEVSNNKLFDFIQIPFNLLDNSNKRESTIRDAKSCGLKVQVRSIFLQGLFFKSHSLIPRKLEPLKKYMNELKQLSIISGMSVDSLALKYVLEKKYIDNVIFGVDNYFQLKKNISVLRDKASVSTTQIDKINVVEEELLNPSNW